MKRPTNSQIKELLRNSDRLRDGELEMDENAKVSRGDDNGAYVQVWAWVSFNGTPFEKEKEATCPG